MIIEVKYVKKQKEKTKNLDFDYELGLIKQPITKETKKLLKELYDKLTSFFSTGGKIEYTGKYRINGDIVYIFSLKHENRQAHGSVIYIKEYGEDLYLVELTYAERDLGYIYNLRYKKKGDITEYTHEPEKVVEEILKTCVEPENLISISRTIYGGYYKAMIVYDDHNI